MVFPSILYGEFFGFEDDLDVIGEPIDTGLDFRQPVLEWTLRQQSRPGDPIEAYIDTAARDR